MRLMTAGCSDLDFEPCHSKLFTPACRTSERRVRVRVKPRVTAEGRCNVSVEVRVG
jgi:hypothetical protein